MTVFVEVPEPKWEGTLHESRYKICAFLASQGGSIFQKSGLASSIIFDAGVYNGSSQALSSILKAMEAAGEVEREMNAKRTFRITLTPHGKAKYGLLLPGADPVEEEPEPEPEPVEPAIAAEELLAAVAQVLRQGAQDAVDDDVRRRMNRLHEHAQSLEKETRRLRLERDELQDRVQALLHEQRGLRDRLRQYETNLEEMSRRLSRGDADRERELRDLDHLMRERPVHSAI